MTPRAIIYARYSPRPNADESESNAKQLACCRVWCDQHGYEVVAEYTDEEVTGGDDDKNLDPYEALAHRHGLLEALDALKPGMVLVVRWRSRLARDVYLEEWIYRRAASAGARIEAVEVQNGESSDAQMIRQVLAAFRERERKILRVLTSRAMLKHQANGRRMSSHVPYGWSQDPEDQARMIENPAEQAVVQRIIDEWRQNNRHLIAPTISMILCCRQLPKETGATTGTPNTEAKRLLALTGTRVADRSGRRR